MIANNVNFCYFLLLYRRFKSADVPTSLEKSAPDFCAVYVIYKGKVQSMRASNVCLMPSAAGASARSSGMSSGSSVSSYWTGNSKSSFGGSSASSHSSIAPSDRYYSPGNSNPRIPIGGESPSHMSDGGHYSNPRMPVGGESPSHQYNHRSSDSYSSSPNHSSSRLQGTGPPPAHRYSNASSDYNSR